MASVTTSRLTILLSRYLNFQDKSIDLQEVIDGTTLALQARRVSQPSRRR